MNKLVVLPRLRQARREASLWIVRVDRGLSEQETLELRAWAALPVNKRALQDIAALWKDLGVLATLAELFPREAPAAAKPPAPEPPPVPLLGSPHRLRGLAAALAGTVALAFAIGFALQRQQQPVEATSTAADTRLLETPVGGTRQVALRDGSAVTLNTDTQLAVAYGHGSRELRLARGEVHFRVAHDERIPFRVHAGGRLVEAVGTAFSIRLREGGAIDLLVTEGAVKVRSDSDRQDPAIHLVRAQQLAHIDAAGNARVESLEDVDIDIRLAWQRGMLIFQGEPLGEVLQEFNRYSTESFVCATPELRALRVGGYFRAGDTDALLVALRENFHITSTRDPRGRIVLNVAR